MGGPFTDFFLPPPAGSGTGGFFLCFPRIGSGGKKTRHFSGRGPWVRKGLGDFFPQKPPGVFFRAGGRAFFSVFFFFFFFPGGSAGGNKNFFFWGPNKKPNFFFPAPKGSTPFLKGWGGGGIKFFGFIGVFFEVFPAVGRAVRGENFFKKFQNGGYFFRVWGGGAGLVVFLRGFSNFFLPGGILGRESNFFFGETGEKDERLGGKRSKTIFLFGGAKGFFGSFFVGKNGIFFFFILFLFQKEFFPNGAGPRGRGAGGPRRGGAVRGGGVSGQTNFFRSFKNRVFFQKKTGGGAKNPPGGAGRGTGREKRGGWGFFPGEFSRAFF